MFCHHPILAFTIFIKQLHLFLIPNYQIDEAESDNDIDDVPDGTAESDFEEGLEEKGQGGKQDSQSALFSLKMAIGEISEYGHRHKPHQLIVAVWHRCQTEEQEDCKD